MEQAVLRAGQFFEKTTNAFWQHFFDGRDARRPRFIRVQARSHSQALMFWRLACRM